MIKKSLLFASCLSFSFFYIKAPEISPGVFIRPWMYVHGPQPTDPTKRSTSYPYIAGDTFRSFCTYIIDETSIPFRPAEVKDGDTIFLNAELLDYFFTELHHRIKSKYILVSHCSDTKIPGKYQSCLEDGNLAAWFSINVEIDHPKLHSMPIGIANKYWPWGNIPTLDKMVELAPKIQKDRLLYMNFTTSGTRDKRKPIYDYFVSKPFCYTATSKPWHEYLLDTARSKFILSPEGNGRDCHRTWEALFMGSIPIVTHSPLDKLFEGLPVLIIDDWHQVTEGFLNEQYAIITSKTYNREKLYAHYWLNQITACQEKVRKESHS